MAIFSSSAMLLCLLLLLLRSSVSVQAAQPRFLHGLFSESPVALPPSAYQFFHPNSPPAAAQVVAAPRGIVRGFSESSAPARGGADAETALVLGFIAVVIFAMGVFCGARRRANARRMELPVGGSAHEKEGGPKAFT